MYLLVSVWLLCRMAASSSTDDNPDRWIVASIGSGDEQSGWSDHDMDRAIAMSVGACVHDDDIDTCIAQHASASGGKRQRLSSEKKLVGEYVCN